MKRNLILFVIISMTFLSCKKKESTTIERSTSEAYYLNMAAYTNSPLSANETNNFFQLNMQDNMDAELTSLGYDLKKWKMTTTSFKINQISFAGASSSGIGDAIDSIQISISKDNFISSELLINEKMLADVNSGSSYSFVASQFNNTNLQSYVNDNAKINIKLIPKSGTVNAQDFNGTFNFSYKVMLDEL